MATFGEEQQNGSSTKNSAGANKTKASKKIKKASRARKAVDDTEALFTQCEADQSQTLAAVRSRRANRAVKDACVQATPDDIDTLLSSLAEASVEATFDEQQSLANIRKHKQPHQQLEVEVSDLSEATPVTNKRTCGSRTLRSLPQPLYFPPHRPSSRSSGARTASKSPGSTSTFSPAVSDISKTSSVKRKASKRKSSSSGARGRPPKKRKSAPAASEQSGVSMSLDDVIPTASQASSPPATVSNPPSSLHDVTSSSQGQGQPGFFSAFQRFVQGANAIAHSPQTPTQQPATVNNRRRSDENVSELARYLTSKSAEARVKRSRSTEDGRAQPQVASCSLEESCLDADDATETKLRQQQTPVMSCYKQAKMHGLKLKKQKALTSQYKGRQAEQDARTPQVSKCANCRRLQRSHNDHSAKCSKHRSGEIKVKFPNFPRLKGLSKTKVLSKRKGRVKLMEKTRKKLKSKRSSPKSLQVIDYSSAPFDSTLSGVEDDDDVMSSSFEDCPPSNGFFIDEKGSPTKIEDSTCDSDVQPLPVVSKKKRKAQVNDMGYSQPRKRRKKKSHASPLQVVSVSDSRDLR